jgi:ABC-2 type transport system permease protein
VTARSQVGLVAEREIRERLRTKAFRIVTVIMCVVVVGAGVAAGLIGGGGDKSIDVGTVGPDAARIAAGMRAAGPAFDLKPHARPQPSAAAARRAVDDGDLDLAIVPGPRLLAGVDAEAREVALVQQVWHGLAQRWALARSGVTGAPARAVLAPASLPVSEVGDPDLGARKGVAYVGALLLYLVIFTYGLTIAGAIVEEKSSRVVEILQAAVPPRRLLLGKVIGLGAVGLGQTLLLVVLGAGAAVASGAIEAQGVAAGAAAVTALWFFLGYLVYACAYATAGALSARQEDLQSTTSPLTVLLVGSYVLSTGALDDPDGTLARVLSFLPPSAPIVMPGRAILGAAAWWEVAASGLLTLVTAALLLRLADRVYRGASLQVRGRMSLRAALGGAGR